MIMCEKTGVVWEAGPKHAEMVANQLDMLKSKPVTTPGIKEEAKVATKEERRINLADANGF